VSVWCVGRGCGCSALSTLWVRRPSCAPYSGELFVSYSLTVHAAATTSTTPAIKLMDPPPRYSIFFNHSQLLLLMLICTLLSSHLNGRSKWHLTSVFSVFYSHRKNFPGQKIGPEPTTDRSVSLHCPPFTVDMETGSILCGHSSHDVTMTTMMK
jgi:hypothetical protein